MSMNHTCRTAAAAACLDHVSCLKRRWAEGCRTWRFAADFARICQSQACLDFCLQRGERVGRLNFDRMTFDAWDYIVNWAGEVVIEQELEERSQVRCLVQGAVASCLARVEAAAVVIQLAFLRAYYDPSYKLCRARLGRQFRELAWVH